MFLLGPGAGFRSLKTIILNPAAKFPADEVVANVSFVLLRQTEGTEEVICNENKTWKLPFGGLHNNNQMKLVAVHFSS